jgi:ankyrin repeat protein
MLQIAALGGSVKVVELLIDAGADVNAQGGSNNTALIAAASKEHVDVVTLLIKHGADLNISSRSHGSSLYQAAAAGDTKMVITLLGAGADINEIGVSDGTPLYAAAESGSIPLVQLLIRRGADVNKGSPAARYGYPVGAAANKGHSQVVKALIRAGAGVNLSMGHDDFNTLEAAIEGRDMHSFLAVLDAGGNPNAPGRLFHNCFHGAIWSGELAMAKILLERGAEFEDEAFLEAVDRYNQDPWFLNTLLEKNPNIDAWRDNDGSAMHVAIKERNEKAAWLILSRNPFLDAVSVDGSPLGVAIDKGMIDLAKELIRRGVDVNRRVGMSSPFDEAIQYACDEGNGDLTLANMLLEHGANINGGNGAW